MASMVPGSEWLDRVRCWEQSMQDLITHTQTTARQEKNTLQLQLETHPLSFQPSPVLLHLLQEDRRRRHSYGPNASDKQRRQQGKSADYLDRKFESEIRQHYELENAQNCAKWKHFHAQVTEARRQVAARIQREHRQFCRVLGISPDDGFEEQPEQVQPISDVDGNQLGEHSPSTSVESLSEVSDPTANTSVTVADSQMEDKLRLHLAQDWVRQERFNIQEAFTNQSKKLEEDTEVYLGQLDADFVVQRQKILDACLHESTRTQSNATTKARQTGQGSQRQFQSSTKRAMLLQTAPVLTVQPASGKELRLLRRRGTSEVARRQDGDVDKTQQKLDDLQCRLRELKEAAETKRKDGMQWIGRQCAHLFAQLDCKEMEAKVVALLFEEELAETSALRRHVSQIADSLRQHCQQQFDAQGGNLPRLPSASSQKPKQQSSASTRARKPWE